MYYYSLIMSIVYPPAPIYRDLGTLCRGLRGPIMSLSHYEPGQGENNTHNMSCVGHYLSLPSRSPSSLFVWLAVDLHWHCGSCFPIKLSSSKNTRLSMDKKKQLTPELGYAVQPSSAVATRVSITVSAAKREKS